MTISVKDSSGTPVTVASSTDIKNNLDVLVGAVMALGQTTMSASSPVAPASDSPGIKYLCNAIANMTSATSGNVANATATATFGGGDPTKRSFLTGFTCTGSGSTSGNAVEVTVVGPAGAGSLSYAFTFPIGALVGAVPLDVQFNPPINTALNGAIIITLPAGGAGNTHACVSCTGFVQ